MCAMWSLLSWYSSCMLANCFFCISLKLHVFLMKVKLTGPYWFHYIQYRHRIIIASILMALAFIVVAWGGMTNSLGLQLFGVVLCSTQSGFGEASFLAFTAFFESRLALTAWSSGTGFAGIFGFAWVVFFTIGLKASFELTLLIALILPVLFALNFELVMNVPNIKREVRMSMDESVAEFNMAAIGSVDEAQVVDEATNPILCDESQGNGQTENITPTDDGMNRQKARKDREYKDLSAAAAEMTMKERVANTVSLWPFMVPLFLVYFAEYAMQSGVWAAMGFPVDSDNARNNFYEYSNWMYQLGVLVSRSSGMFWKADMKALWGMPILQVMLLLFFLLDAYFQFWYDWSLLALCFVVGLLGGAVYVNGFALISERVPPHLKEFSLSAASIADSLGIAFSNVAGIFIQKAIYDYHGISD